MLVVAISVALDLPVPTCEQYAKRTHDAMTSFLIACNFGRLMRGWIDLWESDFVRQLVEKVGGVGGTRSKVAHTILGAARPKGVDVNVCAHSPFRSHCRVCARRRAV
jgi:hypothetical protein